MIKLNRKPKHGNEQYRLFDGSTEKKRQGIGDGCSVIKMIDRASGMAAQG
ncbi:MAG: hypothetical protein IKH42_02705 [Lachnospiraceae bacterium]|nr:hypothetical protein [Lachnospiraceae bacterium]MBR3581326.1 hypothetical protein [Lachnospiraceae bacterium]